MIVLATVICAILGMCGANPAGPGGIPDDDITAPTGCCDWPSCYDERTQLCLDTCLMTWSQCPRKLFLMSCYSEYMSPFGALPVQCYPDAGPHLEEAESLGLSGSPKEVREQLHQLLNIKNCHGRTGICRPNERGNN
eukprot:TRINITY_DN7487_c0_g1_i1.p1 TRINITY_DN7487_c0_g1~~TRINITY_DN7487_c0_g1_i1.p1  ORF type:complete len:148 (-),score=12.35 TRINITY_DN7487_c0_g1_i1:50-460(-)